MSSIITDQAHALRKRTLIENCQKLNANGNHLEYRGAYRVIRTKISDYEVDSPMIHDNQLTDSLQECERVYMPFQKKIRAISLIGGTHSQMPLYSVGISLAKLNRGNGRSQNIRWIGQ